MTTHYHYWIVTFDPETHRPYLIYGSPNSEEEARQKGMEMLGGINFDIKRYPTSDINKASALLRGKRLESSHSLKEAGKRIGHTKSLRRLKNRQQTRRYV